MAPSVVACRLSAPASLSFQVLTVFLMVPVLVANTYSFLMYERQALTDILLLRGTSLIEDGQTSSLPPFLETVPKELLRCAPVYLPQKKSRRRHGRKHMVGSECEAPQMAKDIN